MRSRVVISCEHASAAVPARYRSAFRGAAAALRSHRGSDLGGRSLARHLARGLNTVPLEAPVTRLLADPNRSLGHRQLLSEWSRRLDADDRRDIIERFWRPHRDAVERAVRRTVTAGHSVTHISVHTFTPIWNGAEREVDVALLYDAARPRERAFVDRWLGALAELRPDLQLRRNYPYRGSADGLTTHLRGMFGAGEYLGIELEVSQHHPLGDAPSWRRLRSAISRSLEPALRFPVSGVTR